jgi:hypothetical protein
MATHPPQGTGVMRLSNALIRTAERAGTTFHRKAAQQIEYWARLGRALEAMPGVSHERIHAALTAGLAFDALSAEERAIALMRLGNLEMNRQSPPLKPGRKGARYGRDAAGNLLRLLPDGQRERVTRTRAGKPSRVPGRKTG